MLRSLRAGNAGGDLDFVDVDAAVSVSEFFVELKPWNGVVG